MRKKRQIHDKIVDRHKNVDVNLDDFAMKIGEKTSGKSGKKRKNDEDLGGIEVIETKSSKSVRDEEHYIPYRPKNYNTEKAYLFEIGTYQERF